MIPEIEDADRYCALTPYLIEAQCDGALIGEWVATSTNPLDSSGVIFSSPKNPVSFVTVPAEGNYLFQFECCS